MPEFEESEATNSSKENYTPSTDAKPKPRTRRRSGGFRTEYSAPASAAEIGEVDAAKALKSEKLSGGAKPAAQPKKERRAPRAEKPAAKSESRADKPTRISNAQPGPETLAAISRVEARLDERKAEREAKRAARDKNRPTKSDQKPTGKKKTSAKQAKSGGLLASILSFFGLGAKEPAQKKGGARKPSGHRSNGGNDERPRGKGQGQNRRGKGGKGQSQNRRAGNGQRRSGKGGSGQRRNDRRSQDNNA